MSSEHSHSQVINLSVLSAWSVQLIEASALVACVYVWAMDLGSTPDADKPDTAYHPFGVSEM